MKDQDLAALLAAQRAAFLDNGPPTLAERRRDLSKLKTAILARREDFVTAARDDFGNRSPQETALIDLAPVVQGINYLHRKLRKWVRSERRHVGMVFRPARAHVAYQPLGVVGIMSPWNIPISLALMPLATAIAAGNRAMVKPSEISPATTAVLADMLRDIFSEDQVAVVTGDAGVGAAFSELPFDHLVFTGSTMVGRLVMKAASDNLTPVTLELGGKSPVIVDRGYRIDKVAEDAVFGKTTNAGQACIAPDYMLLHEEDVASFRAGFVARFRESFPGGRADPAYTTIINDKNVRRLGALLEDARAKGAEVIEVDVEGGGTDAHERSMAPALVLNVSDDMAIMQDEIFGPLLPIVTYRTIEEAIDYVNARPRPLALYYYGPKAANRSAVLGRTTSGNVTVNDMMLHYLQEDLPFGGVGPSGIGAYHGIEGFKAMSHAKGVFVQARFNTSGLARPPFGRIAEYIIKMFLR